MFQQDPQQRLWLINQRNAELIRAAEQHRLARSQHVETADQLRMPLLDSLGTGLARALAAVRRALPAAKAPCSDSAPTAPTA
jgi:hypothetical protein